MWLSKPFYEGLPFIYMGLGAALLLASVYVDAGRWPLILTLFGALCLTGGLVVYLKRREYRTSRSRTAFDETQ